MASEEGLVDYTEVESPFTLAVKQKRLNENKQGIKVRTKEGLTFIEKKLPDGTVQRVSEAKKETFVPIEAAADPKVCEIRNFLFLGSQDAAQNIEGLSQNKISNILNVATGISPAFPEKFTYFNVEILDLPESPLLEKLKECISIIENIKSKNERVLVHCNAGVSRSASIVIGYLMKTEGLSFKDAFSIVKNSRPSINPNEGFREQLIRFEQNK